MSEQQDGLRQFVVATRRAHKGDGTTAHDLVSPRLDIRIKGASNPDNILVEATPKAAERLVQDHGDRLMVEGAIPHEIL